MNVEEQIQADLEAAYFELDKPRKRTPSITIPKPKNRAQRRVFDNFKTATEALGLVLVEVEDNALGAAYRIDFATNADATEFSLRGPQHHCENQK